MTDKIARNRANDRFYNAVFKASLSVAEMADLSHDDTVNLARDLTGKVVEAYRQDIMVSAEGSPPAPPAKPHTPAQKC